MATSKARCIVIVSSLTLAFACLIVPWLAHYLGAWSRHFDVIAGLRMQFFLAAAVALALAAPTRSRWVIGAAVVALIWNGAAVLPWYFARPTRPSAVTFKAFSLNVLHQNQRFTDVVQLVRRERPLIAVFQEVTEPWPEKLAPLRAEFAHHFRADGLQMEIFSRMPIDNPKITVVGEMRGFVQFRVRHESNDVVVFASHTYPPVALGAEGFRWRNEQLIQTMPRHINTFSNLPVLVLGDLNTTMWSWAYRELIRQTGLRNARQGFGVCPTLGDEHRWMKLLALPYDHCLVNQRLAVAAFRTGPFVGSDHLPIIAELSVRPPP